VCIYRHLSGCLASLDVHGCLVSLDVRGCLVSLEGRSLIRITQIRHITVSRRKS